LKPKGDLVLDQGACKAISQNGKSLLPSGIKKVEGQFGVGDPVRCLNMDNKPVAVGLTNFSSEELRKIKGVRTDQIAQILGSKESDEVMHRDNLVIL
jgi:glutamate 5-kinase